MLEPNKNKLKALLFLVLAVYSSNIVADYLTEQFIISESLIAEISNKTIVELGDVASRNFNEYVRLGVMTMGLRLLSLVVFIYLAVSVISRKKWLS